MGHYDCTFGAWMKAKPIKTSRTEKYRGCSNTKPNCSNAKKEVSDSFDFCPKCGAPVKQYTRKVNDTLQLSDFVYPEEGEAMKCFENLTNWDDGNVLTGDCYKKQVDLEGGKMYQPWAKDGEGPKGIINPQKEIDDFKKKYKKAIDVLTKAGFDLSFEWGVFTTYN